MPFDHSFRIADVIRRAAVAGPVSVALISGDQEITWSFLNTRSDQVAAALRKSAIAPQDRVAMLLPNVPAYFEILFGAAKGNVTAVPLNWRLAAPELVDIIVDSGAKILFVSDSFLPGLHDYFGELGPDIQIVILGGATDTYQDWLAKPLEEGYEPASGTNDVALQLYTSGTTGKPKGVMLTNRNMAACVPANARRFRFDGTAVNLVAMPLFHIGGISWALMGMAAGAKTVLLPEFNAQQVLESIAKYRITHALLVPAALLFVTQSESAREADLSSMRVMMYGASPISSELLKDCAQIFRCDFYQTYGLTESTGVVTLLPPIDHTGPESRDIARSAGKPVDGVELRIVDPVSGNDRAEGIVGEVWLRSEQVMSGYWRKPIETAAALRPEGWLKTGDAGYLRNGYLYLYDRIKDMIVTGGENVYPAEVENVLMSYPGIVDVAVIGVPSEVWGEEVKAIVVSRPGHDLDERAVVAFARSRLAGFKIPKTIDVVSELPRNPSGKLLKSVLRAPYWAGKERPIG